MAKTIKGQFATFTGYVGRENYIRVHLVEDGERGHEHGHILNYSDQLAVTMNGGPICCATFLEHLQSAKGKVSSTLYFEDSEICRTADFAGEFQ